MMARAYVVNPQGVYFECFDNDEVVVVNLNLGNYYSVQHVASSVWKLLEVGVDLDLLVPALVAFYQNDPDAMGREINDFFQTLLQEQLIVEAADLQEGSPEVSAFPAVYKTPTLDVFTDLQELFLLDPVHAVDNKMGWPFQPQSAE